MDELPETSSLCHMLDTAKYACPAEARSSRAIYAPDDDMALVPILDTLDLLEQMASHFSFYKPYYQLTNR